MKVLEKNVQQKSIIENIKNGVLRKFPLLGATMSNLTFESSNNIPTAATNGEKVFYSPEFVEELSYDERIFLFSHEIMHDAFDHIMRSKGKDPELWNIATDAVINQMLKLANLPLPEGGVDMPEANGKSAEEMYEILLEKQQQNEQNQNGENNGNNQQNEQQNGQDNNSSQHSMWEDAVNQAEQKQQEQEEQNDGNNGNKQQQGQQQQDNKEQSKNQQSQSQDQQSQSSGQNSGHLQRNLSSSKSISEKEKNFTKNNEKLKQQLGEQIREKLKRQKEEMSKSGGYRDGCTINLNDLGNANALLSWKKILKRELEKEEDRWTYRRADEDNDYQARIGTLEVEDHPETEVMLDVSGSIDDDFLKGFLRQLKPLVKESKLKVGFFADYATKEFQEIKSLKDIEHLKIFQPGCGTNIDAAARAFSRKKEINKIVFTDGYSYDMPKEDLKKLNIIWLVFGNKDFKPCCGKVIFIDEKELRFKTLKSKTDDLELSM